MRMYSADWTPCWKLTDYNGRTKKSCFWGVRIENPHGVKDGVMNLCSNSWYHAYDSPLTAYLYNASHANITCPVLWEAEWRGDRMNDGERKFGATEMRTLRTAEMPEFTNRQLARLYALVRFAKNIIDMDHEEQEILQEWFLSRKPLDQKYTGIIPMGTLYRNYDTCWTQRDLCSPIRNVLECVPGYQLADWETAIAWERVLK